MLRACRSASWRFRRSSSQAGSFHAGSPGVKARARGSGTEWAGQPMRRRHCAVDFIIEEEQHWKRIWEIAQRYAGTRNRIEDAEKAGVKSVPALVTPNGNVLHINFGASMEDVKGQSIINLVVRSYLKSVILNEMKWSEESQLIRTQ